MVSSRVEHRRLVAGRPATRPVRLLRGSGTSSRRPVRGRARCWVLRDRRGCALRSVFGRCLGLLAEPDVGLGMGECRPYVENYTVDASIFEHRRSIHLLGVVFENNVLTPWPSGRGTKTIGHVSASDAPSGAEMLGRDSYSCMWCQVLKSKRWMPWQLEPKKDVAICDKPRGADKRALIRGCPNGETPGGVVIRPADSRLNI